MNCPRSEQIDRLIGESLDGVEARALRDHLAGCGVCAGEESRARREKDMLVEELSPWRLKSDLSRRPLPMRRRGTWLRLLPAAVMLAAIGAAMWLARPDRPAPAAGDALLSMEILRRDDKGGAVGPKQVLFEEELPFIRREFLEIGFLDRVEMDTNPPEPRKFPSLEVSVKRRKGGKVEAWLVNVGSSGYVSYSLDGKPSQSASMHPKQFQRLWAVLDRALNPLQAYVDRSDGLKGSVLLVSRGRFPGADPMNTALFVRRRVERHESAAVLGLGGFPGDSRGAGALVVKLPLEDPRLGLSEPGQYLLQMETLEGERRGSIAVPLEMTSAGGPVTEIRVGRESDSLRKVAAVELSRLGGLLEEAGFWREVAAAVPLDARPPEDDGLVIEVTRGGRKTRVYLTGGVNRGRMLVADEGPADRTGEPAKEVFDRLWTIVERAVEPLQVYLERQPDGGHRALLVYRGGAAGWKDAGEVGLLLSTGGGVVAYKRVALSEFGVRLPEKGGAFEAEIDLGKRLAAVPHDPSVSWGWTGAESPRAEAEEIAGCRRAVEEILKAAADGKAEVFAARLWPVKDRAKEEYREVMETLRADRAAGVSVRMSGLTPGAVPKAVKAADPKVDAYFLVAFEKSWDREGGAGAVTGFSYAVVRREGRFLLEP